MNNWINAGDYFKLIKATTMQSQRIARDEIEDRGKIFVVSTVDSPDCGYETAIGTSEHFYPVERYDDLGDAIDGHKKWIEKIKGGQRKIIMLGYGRSIAPKTINLEDEYSED